MKIWARKRRVSPEAPRNLKYRDQTQIPALKRIEKNSGLPPDHAVDEQVQDEPEQEDELQPRVVHLGGQLWTKPGTQKTRIAASLLRVI